MANQLGVLYQHSQYTNQWKWKKNVIVAESIEEAQKILEDHAIKCENGVYWQKYGKGNFQWRAGNARGILQRHTVDPSMWMFKNFIFYADTVEEVFEITRKHFGSTMS